MSPYNDVEKSTENHTLGIDFLPPNRSAFYAKDCYRDNSGLYVVGLNPMNQEVVESAISSANQVIEATKVWGERLKDETEENSKCAISARIGVARLVSMARFTKAPDDIRERCRQILRENRPRLAPLFTLMDSVDPDKERNALSFLAAAQNDYQDLGEFEVEKWPSMLDYHEAQIKSFIDLSPTFVSLKDPIGLEVFSERGPSVCGTIEAQLSGDGLQTDTDSMAMRSTAGGEPGVQ